MTFGSKYKGNTSESLGERTLLGRSTLRRRSLGRSIFEEEHPWGRASLGRRIPEEEHPWEGAPLGRSTPGEVPSYQGRQQIQRPRGENVHDFLGNSAEARDSKARLLGGAEIHVTLQFPEPGQRQSEAHLCHVLWDTGQVS